jgi:DNA repair exonuclease SbcCD nuclease subunit
MRALIFTDLHVGLRSDSVSRLNIVKDVGNKIAKACKDNNIDYVFFLGDLFHSRSSISVYSMNVAIDIIRTIAKNVKKLYLILGNHDIYYKNQLDVHSSKIFESVENVIIVDKLKAIQFGTQKILMVPWLANIEKIPNESFDIVMGHFDIPSNYLIKSYVEDNLIKTTSTDELKISLIEAELVDSTNTSENIDNLLKEPTKSSDMLGDFVLKAKKTGTIFSGHIHSYKFFNSKGRKFMFVGSPYEQTFGEMDNKCGYVILESTGKYNFVDILDTPKHKLLKTSELKEVGIDNYDFSSLKNCIVKRIIDVKETRTESLAIQDKLNSSNIYEELPSEYLVRISNNENLTESTDDVSFANNIVLSKMNYIKEYIEHINEKELKPNNIDKDKLYKLIEEYSEGILN